MDEARTGMVAGKLEALVEPYGQPHPPGPRPHGHPHRIRGTEAGKQALEEGASSLGREGQEAVAGAVVRRKFAFAGGRRGGGPCRQGLHAGLAQVAHVEGALVGREQVLHEQSHLLFATACHIQCTPPLLVCNPPPNRQLPPPHVELEGASTVSRHQ